MHLFLLHRVPLSIRALAYCEGVKQGAEDVWNNVQKIYSREKIEVERQRLLQALCCSRDSFTLKKYFIFLVPIFSSIMTYVTFGLPSSVQAKSMILPYSSVESTSTCPILLLVVLLFFFFRKKNIVETDFCAIL